MRAAPPRGGERYGTTVSADGFLRALTQALYVLIAAFVVVRAVRRPDRANVDMALFFATSALVIAPGVIVQTLGLARPSWLGDVTTGLAMALPYLLLRLVADFSEVPGWLNIGGAVGLAGVVVALVALPSPLPLLATLLMVMYFLALMLYSTMAFVRESGRSQGVTRRRMQAVGLGSLFLGLTILMAGVSAAFPAQAALSDVVGRVFSLLSGLAYLFGFAPPAWLRQAWQEPELRAFLGRAARLPRLPDTRAIVEELERGAATSIGTPRASIGLWDERAGALRFYSKLPPEEAGRIRPGRGVALHGDTWEIGPESLAAGTAFTQQRPVLVADAPKMDPEHAEMYLAAGATAMLAAPITAGQKRLGVLSVYGSRAPIFGDTDLELVQLLADQAAVILESRALIDEAARVQAREEATRLKDDFLSSAAHDLRTPLTTLLGQAQVLERRAVRDELADAYRQGLGRIVSESRRLTRLVHELLDASRAERGHLVGEREWVDLAEVAREARGRAEAGSHRCVIEAAGPVAGAFDLVRMRQLLDNLVENAIKYSPDGGEVRVALWTEDGEARISVSDEGIGIPPEDLPELFQRFHRGTNVDDRRFAGMGLGLYICRAIVEEHGGRIWAEDRAGGPGSTFQVALPVAVPAARAGLLEVGAA